jgi:predicted transglutaminase-like cysteine proteinase
VQKQGNKKMDKKRNAKELKGKEKRMKQAHLHIFKASAFLFILLIFLSNCFPALADVMSKEGTIFTGHIIIRQQRHKVGSIFIAQPVPVDLKILNIINTEDIKSFQDYTQWLQKNIQYKKDTKDDEWSLPEQTLARGYGDCEDFAFLNAAFLQLLGYKPKVLAMVGGIKNDGHAICVFNKDGYYFWFDNTRLKKLRASSMQEFAHRILNKYAHLSLYEIGLTAKGSHNLGDNLQ